MSVNTDQVVQVWPLPDNQYMNSNKQVISDIDDRDIVKYTPNGEYEITASSYANGETNPYVTSNEDDRDFWQCDYKNNPNYKNGKYTQYTQNPYTGGNNASAYQGGGSIKDNLWTTQVGSTKVVNVRGEWIQVKIPFKAYIQQYHIKTPTYTQHNTFPRKFMLVASPSINSSLDIPSAYAISLNSLTGSIPIIFIFGHIFFKYLILLPVPAPTSKIDLILR